MVFKFCKKEAHLYLFYTGNSQNLPVDIPLGKKWHRHWRRISKHKESQKRRGGDTDRPRNQTTQYLLPGSLDWKLLLEIWKSTHCFRVGYRTVTAFIQSPWTSAAHVDFSWSCVPGHYNGHNSLIIIPCCLAPCPYIAAVAYLRSRRFLWERSWFSVYT